MTKFKPRDDVIVDFDGIPCRGEVVGESHGWVMAIIETDPVCDFGSMTARLAPHSTVCVPASRVRHAEENI